MRRFARAFVLAVLFAIAATAGASAQADRSVALVLDASGSMTARLPDGTSRIEAAKAAVADLLGRLPGETRLAFRAYGHQSPTSKKDCRDTALLAGFDRVAANKAAILDQLRAIRAQGYTPITHVLKLAAQDLAAESAASRVIVLVSDGKETCEGDPCATARALAEADARLVIHAIGLAVDGAARYQLRCIASVARGLYVDAGDTAELRAALGKAAAAAPVRRVEDKPRTDPGKLRIEGATAYPHEVLDAATRQKVTVLSAVWPERALPPGIYNVTFDNGIWMGVEVRAGETTLLRPGRLVIERADLWGHELLDPETGEVAGKFLAHKSSLPLLPTRFLVTFGKTRWPDLVEIEEGKTTTLKPGAIAVRSQKPFKAILRGADGQPAQEVSSSIPTVALPPGAYTLEAGEKKLPITLEAGKLLEVRLD